MKVISFFLLILMPLVSTITFAGGTMGGGFPSVQLEKIALSETHMNVVDLETVADGSTGGGFPGVQPESIALPETTKANDLDVLISVSSSDFDKVATNARENSGITYRDAEAKVVSIDHENRIIALHLTENPQVTLIVKENSQL